MEADSGLSAVTSDSVCANQGSFRLCKIGLGSKWFTNDYKLVVDVYLSAEEFHFLLVCLFPPIRYVPYEICKATGPGNSVVVPLAIDDENLRPQQGKSFQPFFSIVQLKVLTLWGP